jgi:hypothetical protein
MHSISSVTSAGVMAAQRRFDTAAVRVVRGEISPVNAVQMVQSRHSLEAQVRVARANYEMTGRVLDIFA